MDLERPGQEQDGRRTALHVRNTTIMGRSILLLIGTIVVGSDVFVYSYVRGSTLVNVRITFTVHFKAVA